MKTDFLEFEKFYQWLMSNAPADYIPWFFPVMVNGKNPDGKTVTGRAPPNCQKCNVPWQYNPEEKKVQCPICKMARGSWKAPHARLTFEEAIERLKKGGNVGIAARADDCLVLYDIDVAGIIIKVATLMNRTRKRVGFHCFNWCDPADQTLNTNITTDKGELRTCDQYVLAAGSFVPVSEKEKVIDDPKLGLYTVENAVPPKKIVFDDLPDIFLEQHKKNLEQTERIFELQEKTIKPTGKHSALFDLTIQDVVGDFEQSDRFPHPMHSSETGKNFSISGDLGHCWRHLVSLNPIQFLCVKAGYLSCESAGTGHKGNASPSAVTGDDGAIFWAWLEAKKSGLISQNDKIPIRAMKYVAVKHKLAAQNLPQNSRLPTKVFNAVLKVVKEEY